MNDINIDSLEHYIEKISGFSDVFFYRGVSNISYKLIPSAGRFGIENEKTQIQFERSLLNDFIRKAPIYLKESPQNDIDWMILAQHHGIPTRLMDWSFNPLVALFFAVENDNNSDCAIYSSLLFSGQEAKNCTFDYIFKNDNFKPIFPNFTHQRFVNQESLFTLHSKPTEFDKTKISSRYIIKNSVKQSIRWKLRRIGITKSFIYPILDSLAYDIIEVHKLSYKDYIKQ